jgi:hypothetical protein
VTVAAAEAVTVAAAEAVTVAAGTAQDIAGRSLGKSDACGVRRVCLHA